MLPVVHRFGGPWLPRVCLALALGLGLAIPAQANTIYLCSDEDESTSNLGRYTGSLSYTSNVGGTSATIVISLTNSLTSAAGGKIVAFVLLNPDDYVVGADITGVALSTATNLTTLLGGAAFQDLINASPFADMDIGASLGGNNNNGFSGAPGNPNDGITIGNTGSWTFTLTGTGLNLISATSFLGPVNYTDEFFIVRFRGFDNGGSDKVPGELCDQGKIPEPDTIVLLGIGLVGLAWRARRRPVSVNA